MRFRALKLQAFGPFTGHQIDLGGGAPGGLHVIYGPNEAGKSTALRAVHDLLFGIPERTGDAHLHPSQELKLGAVLEGPDGRRLEIQRWKKRKDSLRRADGAPLDESVMQAFLRGVDESLFARLFGLDHERLRQAGEDLLAGRGDVGESLFDAGGGGRGVRQVLEELGRRADELFKPRSSKAKLNHLLEQYAEAKRLARDATRPPDKYLEQRAAVERAERERERLREERRKLREEEHRLKRIRANLPKLAELRSRREKLLALGEVRPVPERCRERRTDAEQRLAAAERELERCRRELERRKARRDGLEVAQGLLEIGPQELQELRDGVGQTRKALKDQPRLLAASRAAEEDARLILRRLGHDMPLEEAERLRLSSAEAVRIRRLGEQRAVLLERRALAQKLTTQTEQELSRARAKLAALPERRETRALETAVRKARAAGDLDERLREHRAALSNRSARAAQRLAALGHFQGELAALARLELPLPESLTRFEAEFQTLAERRRALEDEARRALSRRAECERQIQALQAGGEVPSLEDLQAARARRDQGLSLLLNAWRTGASADAVVAEHDADRPIAQALERDVRNADELADRLRREASRVSELASLRAELEQASAAQRRSEEELAALGRDEADLSVRWTALWAAAGITPSTPREMQGWLAKRGELVELHDEIERERRAVETYDDERRTLCALLERALGDALPKNAVGDLLALTVAAEEELRALSTAAERARELEALVESLELKHDQARRELDEHTQALERWSGEWAVATRPLGLPDEAGPEEASLVLAELSEFFKKLDEMKKERKRVLGIQRDAEAFSDLVRRLCSEHAPDLEGKPADVAAELLVERYDKARHDREERGRIERELGELGDELEAIEGQRAAAERELAELYAQAKVGSSAELCELENRAEQRAELEAELARIEAELRDSGEGLSLEELIEEAKDVDRASLAARLEELAELHEKSDEALVAADREVTSLSAGLSHYSERQAADAAQDVEVLAAEIRRHAADYARLSLAEKTLRREIERYRERNQGPVLKRAQALFARLTLGRYSALRVGLEEAVLVCVRADGKEVGVSELSEGTRYQLYLALRIASLERYLEQNAPLPLVLDDVLIHFDDERASAALAVLSDLAAHLQILFFTHHARDLELARASVAKNRLFEHVLPVRGVEIPPAQQSLFR